jgi:hypothetical protein
MLAFDRRVARRDNHKVAVPVLARRRSPAQDHGSGKSEILTQQTKSSSRSHGFHHTRRSHGDFRIIIIQHFAAAEILYIHTDHRGFLAFDAEQILCHGTAEAHDT